MFVHLPHQYKKMCLEKQIETEILVESTIVSDCIAIVGEKSDVESHCLPILSVVSIREKIGNCHMRRKLQVSCQHTDTLTHSQPEEPEEPVRQTTKNVFLWAFVAPKGVLDF